MLLAAGRAGAGAKRPPDGLAPEAATTERPHQSGVARPGYENPRAGGAGMRGLRSAAHVGAEREPRGAARAGARGHARQSQLVRLARELPPLGPSLASRRVAAQVS